jgi:hypothetical protein
MSDPNGKLVSTKERATMANKEYTLFEYSLNGSKVVSAIYFLDVAKFLREHPDATPKK